MVWAPSPSMISSYAWGSAFLTRLKTKKSKPMPRLIPITIPKIGMRLLNQVDAKPSIVAMKVVISIDMVCFLLSPKI